MQDIIQKIKQAIRYTEFHDYGDSVSFGVDRYRRHDHGGGDDGDEWLEDHEVDNDFEQGVREHKHKLERVNEILKENGYEDNAMFELGEKGHFSIDIIFKKAK